MKKSFVAPGITLATLLWTLVAPIFASPTGALSFETNTGETVSFLNAPRRPDKALPSERHLLPCSSQDRSSAPFCVSLKKARSDSKDLDSPRFRVLRQSVLPPERIIGGDIEVIEARLGDSPLGLVTYVRDIEGKICDRTGEVMQEVFVQPINPRTGTPISVRTEKKLGSDECGDPFFSDAEFGLGPKDEPLVAYTADDGVRLVQFYGTAWKTLRFRNQLIPGSEDWIVGAEPVSRGLPEIQLDVIEKLDPINRQHQFGWSRLEFANFGTIVKVEPIWQFFGRAFQSHLHPGDPTRFIRSDEWGMYEVSDTGETLAEIYPALPIGNFRTWMMPANECIALGLQPPQVSAPCPAVVFGDRDPGTQVAYLVAKARSSIGVWVEVLRVSYLEVPRANAVVAKHLDPPRTVILATGDQDAKLYTLDGTVFTVADNQAYFQGSELLYLSATRSIGVYYRDLYDEEVRRVSLVGVF